MYEDTLSNGLVVSMQNTSYVWVKENKWRTEAIDIRKQSSKEVLLIYTDIGV